MIIDNNRRFLTVQEEHDHVNTGFVDLFCNEHGFDALRELCQRAQRGQEVAISELTLVDVVRLNTVLENVDRVEDLTGSLPFKRVESSLVNIHVDVLIVE